MCFNQSYQLIVAPFAPPYKLDLLVMIRKVLAASVNHSER